MGISDWFYPDNPKRERRAKELASDCAKLVREAKKDYDQLKTYTGKLNEKVIKLFQDISKEPPDLQKVQYQIEKHKISFDLQHRSMIEIFNMQPVVNAIQTSSAAFLLSNKKLSASVFNTIVGLPTYLVFNSGLELVKFVINDIIGIFTGEKRARLRRVLQEAGKARVKLKVSQLVNNETLVYIRSIENALDALTEVGYDPEDINAVFIKSSEKEKNKISKINGKQAIKQLKSLDNKRGSWIKEG
ncbi:hypothetical protein [Aquimarina sp. 2201CG5-10]|uniref:hypothetical protein n=1 Tax=Aquimarina callyspongiae TaxID=3098150 RepID=UPI002AB4C00D|nr:hypothetical protein [Aquimarina sp. 2201CG5-10]MDY8137379.1 hypothetical protein [Aquimarina sp. 2201CG5-10]